MIKIGAVFVPVTNLEHAIEWYKEKLDLNHVGTWPENKGADFYFTEEKQYLSLVKVEEKQAVEFTANATSKNPYYNFTTVDLEAYHQHLQQKGVKVTEIKDHGPILGFDFYDNDGNVFGVIVDKEEFDGFYQEDGK
ncbi:Glyoxalase/Bleomycin resistance protein/Dioxygenase superfamily protein [Evansella caseinilytica]|uniref:Glyoxalase/Bleomycin resistance protein/Dioxygenase superfamily protein n=1 Tax=Evansella caseinilytica TaxID=1503961 RepID=A0A1H3UXB8_9BACI|nr:VOC family protein [Evansella caseinilytica]SDZ67084.1 Glyoxalase/Bleomycin resistance protein/Dioxygenase superfamily protein [Evansella caseinilytica]